MVIVRRSRRISNQPPRARYDGDYASLDLNLLYPDPPSPDPSAFTAPDTPSFSSTTPSHPARDLAPRSPSPDFVPSHSHSPAPRSSHSRKKKSGHIPRPPNAFMLFRSEYWRQEKTKPQAERDHRQISCTAGELWKQLSPKEQAPFRLLADEEKAKHAERYPEYKYSPVYRRDRPAKRTSKADKVSRAHASDKVSQARTSDKAAHRSKHGHGDVFPEKKSSKRRAREDDDDSDASEYLEGPARKRTRKSLKALGKKAAVPRPYVVRAPKVESIDEDIALAAGFDDECTIASPKTTSSALAKEESSSSPSQSLPTPPSVDGDFKFDSFVPTSAIPELSLGEAYDISEQIHFTNPFASYVTSTPKHYPSLDPLVLDRPLDTLASDYGLGFPGAFSPVPVQEAPEAVFEALDRESHTVPRENAYEFPADYMATLGAGASILDEPDFTEFMTFEECE